MNALMRFSEKKRAAGVGVPLDPAKMQAFSSSPLIEPEEITLIKAIGAGKYGTLYHGKCRELDVAIKVPKKQELNHEELAAFNKEVEIMSKMFCPHIALFMGASTKPFAKTVCTTGETVSGNIMIVSELMRGDVETLLHNSSEHLSLVQRMQMARDVAQGMAWLHGGEEAIMHRDLKLSNLLYEEMGGVYHIKVCDFGLSQVKPKNAKVSDPKGKVIGTVLMLPPEVLKGNEFNERADVYSFALVVWQLLTREELFPDLRDGLMSDFIDAICTHHHRPSFSCSCPDSLKELLERCWHWDPSQRPAFSEILGSITSIIVDSAIKDENARKMWKESFLTDYAIPFDEFYSVFCKYIDHEPSFEQLECLKALIVSKDGKELVTMEKFGQLLGWFGPLEVPYTAPGFLDRIVSICGGGWFFGEMSTQDAVNRLSNSSPGTFLVRFGNSPEYEDSFSITKVTRQNLIIHIRVLHPKPNEFTLVDGHMYKSLQDVITDRRLNLVCAYPNPQDAETRLSNPFGHIFARRATSMISAYRDVDDDAMEDMTQMAEPVALDV